MPASTQQVPVYVTHQNLTDHGGGASAVTAWVLQALWRHFDVRLAMPGRAADFLHIDDLYGTSLAQATVGVHSLGEPPWLRALPSQALKSLRLAIALRDPVLRSQAGGLVFNTANEMSFAGPSVTYVHCPIRHRRMIAELSGGYERWLRTVNNAAFTLVSGFDKARFRQSVCVANSKWTASALRRTYGLDARVIYPPVALPVQAPKPLEERSPGYVCIGRIAREKRTHEAVELVDEMRRRGYDVHLHIVGRGSGPYARAVEMAARARPYVSIHHELSRDKLATLLNEHRFGLHMMRNEHFGMAVAEMAAAGVIVLAHHSAGPVEILGAGSPLLFHDATEAAETGERVLSSRSLRSDLQEQIEARGIRGAFSPEVFTASIRGVVEEALA